MRRFFIPEGAESVGIYKDGWIDFNKNGVMDPYEDPSKPVEERVEDLLSLMTLEEKLAQLRSSFEFGEVGNLSIILRAMPPKDGAKLANEIQRKMIEGTRLGIPVIIHDECLHGCMAMFSTQFPQAIALAATWDPDLVYRVAKAIARETRARGIHQCLSPVVNLARDVRAGRTEETYGEDPYLASIMGEAFCKALREEGVIATPKHFVVNFEAEGGRDSFSVDLSERILREIFFPPFRACVKAGALSIMAAYNSLDGVPCSSNRWLLTDVLRRKWGFRGFVVSDYGSVSGIITHHYATDLKEMAAKLALEAGLEVELPRVDVYGEALEKAVKEGLIAAEVIDEAVRRVLFVKFTIGLFDNPFIDPDEAEKIVGCEEHKKLALEAARKAIVLLKNDSVLPLDRRKLRRLLVVGGAAKHLKLGGYSGTPRSTVTPLEAIADKVKDCGVKLDYVEAVPIGLECSSGLHNWLPGVRLNYIAPPRGVEGDGVRIEVFDNPNFEGKPVVDYVGLYWGGFRYELGYRKPHASVMSDNYSVRFSGRLLPPKQGRYKLCLSVAGGRARLILDSQVLAEVDATGRSLQKVVEIDLVREEHDLVVEYSRTRGYAAVRLGWDLVESEEMRKAVELASEADAVIFFAEVIEGEEKDRASLRLPASQEKLIERLLAANQKLIVVLMTGVPVVGDWVYKVPCLVQAWYPGELGGLAVVDVLFGDYNPAGRLPFTWPHHEGQLPLYYNYKPSGRVYDYVNMTGAPLFPFGHGLSYTKFEYSNLKVETEEEGKRIKVSFTVKNTGGVEGEEVVQLYLRDQVSSVARPIKELKRFKRVALKPGDETEVVFTLTPDDLAMYDRELRRVVEPGKFTVMVGSSAEDIRLQGDFEVGRWFKACFNMLGVEVEQAGGYVNLKARVRNDGDVADLARIALFLDGTLVDEYPIEVPPQEVRSAVLRVKKEDAVGRIIELALNGHAFRITFD
ncbi:MAG: glycoside hydrolase family 3 C-terminal domain-containing protein [Thermofilaceae archaeon]|nr:glycoside hydrolase family 3 C-terminal domain-containing protein [Thermofilaceae archaeon]MDW8004252.1 glycoside hydrolase family 3 N-terminal domain-containing protein [Thermofilaceae archaeon]